MARIKPWLLLALIFIVGIITGSALTELLQPHFVHQPPQRGPMQDRLLAHLTRKLDLTEDQQTKIKPILADVVNQGQTVHHDEVERMTQIMDKANQQIAAFLTPEQQTKLQKMQSEERAGHHHGWDHSDHGGAGAPPANVPPSDH